MRNINKFKALIICNLILIVVLCSSIILNYKLYQLYIFHEVRHSVLDKEVFEEIYEMPTIQKMSDTENLIDLIYKKKAASYDNLKTLKENCHNIEYGISGYVYHFSETYMYNYYKKTIFNIQPPDMYNTYNKNNKSMVNATFYFLAANGYISELNARANNNSNKDYKELAFNNKDLEKLTIIKNVINGCRKVYENTFYKCKDIEDLSKRVAIRFKAIKKLSRLYNEYELNKKIDERYTENGFEKSPFNPLNK
jgi:ribosomal protein S8